MFTPEQMHDLKVHALQKNNASLHALVNLREHNPTMPFEIWVLFALKHMADENETLRAEVVRLIRESPVPFKPYD